jgi:hypothetical protein
MGPASALRPAGYKKGRPGNAQVIGMTSMTPRALVYAAVQVSSFLLQAITIAQRATLCAKNLVINTTCLIFQHVFYFGFLFKLSCKGHPLCEEPCHKHDMSYLSACFSFHTLIFRHAFYFVFLFKLSCKGHPLCEGPRYKHHMSSYLSACFSFHTSFLCVYDLTFIIRHILRFLQLKNGHR